MAKTTKTPIPRTGKPKAPDWTPETRAADIAAWADEHVLTQGFGACYVGVVRTLPNVLEENSWYDVVVEIPTEKVPEVVTFTYPNAGRLQPASDLAARLGEHLTASGRKVFCIRQQWEEHLSELAGKDN